MDNEQEDVKKLTEFINSQKSSCQNNLELEFQDFVNFKPDYDADFDEESLIEDEMNDEIEEIDVKQLTVLKPVTPEVSVTILTEEENSVIESCTDLELKKLLILNRSKNMQLMKFHKIIKDLLIECENAMEEKTAMMKNVESRQIGQQTFRLAAPYFKDKKFFACLPNEDATRKKCRNELSVYDLTAAPKWLPIEFDRLINAVKCNYNINKQSDIVKKLRALKGSGEETEDNDEKNEILELETQLQQLKKEDKLPPLNSNEFIDWYKVSEIFLRDKRTPSECQAVWHILVHPLINKSDWSEEENKKLESIAKEYSYQRWDEIAQELNTNRTGFITCLHYFSKLCDKFKKNKFSPEEDKSLLEVVDCYKIGHFIPWNKVACHFSNRSRHQLYHRYTYFLSQDHVKRGKFTEAEDILLMILVNKFGRNFKKCAEYMPHRSQVQLKSRYTSNLQGYIKKGSFTKEEDQIIFDHVQKHGEKKWSSLTEKLLRCNAQIRQRYNVIKTFLTLNPNGNIADIPKRKRFDKVADDKYNFLNYMVDQYKNLDYIPTISMIEETLQVENRTPCVFKKVLKTTKATHSRTVEQVKNIDTMLTDFFSSSMEIEQHKGITLTNLNEASDNVEEILSALGVNLNLPVGFECDIHLDNIDVDILEKISKKNKYKENRVKTLIAPNINTLVGLRSLIIKHKDYKARQKSKNLPSTAQSDQMMWSLEQNLATLNETTRSDVLFHRNLFSQRFEALFNWSAVLSLEKPNLCNFSESGESSTATPKTYPPVKKRKIDVGTLTNFSHDSRLKLVDKSVVDKLMQSKSRINIIKLDRIKGPDGVARPVFSQNFTSDGASQEDDVMEVDEFPVAQPIDNETTNSLSSIEDNVIEDEDLEDVQKLNFVLKSELINDSSCDNDYQALQDEVQLLQEVLNSEKVKIQSNLDTF